MPASVAACIRRAIDGVDGADEFRRLLRHIAAQPGRVLARDGFAHWPLFVLATCEALGGDRRGALWPAAAVELAVCAADAADDLADGEWAGASGTWSRGVNAAVALAWLAQTCAAQSAQDLGFERAQRIGRLIAEGWLAASVGEDLDLRLEGEGSVDEEQAHEMSQRKAGSLVAMACEVGAACATDSPALIEAAGAFGTHVGVVAQLLNDIGGVDPRNPQRGTDLARRKKTIPVAYALRVARQEGIQPILDWYEGCAAPSPGTEQELAQAIADLGGLHYAWVVADVHRRQALEALDRLEELAPGRQVRGLRRLVPALRPQRS